MWYLPTTVDSPPTLLSAKLQIAKCNGKGGCFLHPYCCLNHFLDLSCAVTSPPGKPALLLVLQLCSAPGCGSAPDIPRGRCTHWVQAAEAKILHLPSLRASSAPTHLLLLNLPDSSSPNRSKPMPFALPSPNNAPVATYVQEPVFGGRRGIHKLSSRCTCPLGPNSPAPLCSLALLRSQAGKPAGKSTPCRLQHGSEGQLLFDHNLGEFGCWF